MTREEATDEAYLHIVNTELLYRTTHDVDGRYEVESSRRLRELVGDSIPGVNPGRVNWADLHAELLDSND